MSGPALTGPFKSQRARSVTSALDAGIAALATFVVGVYAVRVLELESLGVYALVFSGVLLTSEIPNQLVFTPLLAEVARWDRVERASAARLGLVKGALPMLISAVLMCVVFLFLPRSLSTAETLILLISGGLAAASQAAQLYLRRLQYYSGYSVRSLIAAFLRLVGSGAALLFLSGRFPSVAVPLSSLAFGNLVAIAFLILRTGGPPGRTVHGVLSRGSFLLVSVVGMRGAVFLGSYVIFRLAGASALGYAEAARVVAQPVVVLGLGLLLTSEPLIVGHSLTSRLDRLVSVRRFHLLALAAGTIVYLTVAACACGWNPMFHLLPAAYVIPGLVVVAVAAASIQAAARPFRAELIAQRLEKKVLLSSAPAMVAILGISFLAADIGAFALPVGIFGGGLLALVGVVAFTRRRHRHPSPV